MAGVGSMLPIKIVQLSSERVQGIAKPGPRLVYTGYAEVKTVSGYREYLNGKTNLGHVKSFRIRYHKAISADVNTRLIYAGKQYTITSIDKDNEEKFYWLVRAAAESVS